MLRGCHLCPLPPLKSLAVVLYGLQLIVGEPGSSHNKSYQLFSQTKGEMQEWTRVLQDAISYSFNFNTSRIYRKDSASEQWFQTNEQIGVGRFSKVYSGVDKRNDRPCAVKIVNKAALNDVEREMLRSEVSIVPNVHHPNIVQFTSVIQSAHYTYIISELVRGGELYSLIMRQTLAEDQAALVVYYLLEAIRYLHSCGIVHRDIKPENILVETATHGGEERIVNIKLIDFGLSRVVLPNQVLMEQCGTLAYVAPEVLLKHGYGKEVDLWSVGVVMHLMLRGRLPFDSRERNAIVDHTIYSDIDFSDPSWTQVSLSGKDPMSTCGIGKDLLRRLLEKNPSTRIKTDEALCHPWIVEHVKLKAMKGKAALYPQLSGEEKRRFEDMMAKAADRSPEKRGTRKLQTATQSVVAVK